MQNNGNYAVHGHSVTDFGTKGKNACDFMRVYNSNLPVPPISHRFRDMANYWSKRVPLFKRLTHSLE